MESFQIANDEHFSSTFQLFEVYGLSYFSPSIVDEILELPSADSLSESPTTTDSPPSSFPPEDKRGHYQFLGTYRANNIRGSQSFDLNVSPAWTRYLMFRFVTHYGSKYYCPVTSISVFGKSMIEDTREMIVREDEEIDLLYDTISREKKEGGKGKGKGKGGGKKDKVEDLPPEDDLVPPSPSPSPPLYPTPPSPSPTPSPTADEKAQWVKSEIGSGLSKLMKEIETVSQRRPKLERLEIDTEGGEGGFLPERTEEQGFSRQSVLASLAKTGK